MPPTDRSAPSRGAPAVLCAATVQPRTEDSRLFLGRDGRDGVPVGRGLLSTVVVPRVPPRELAYCPVPTVCCQQVTCRIALVFSGSVRSASIAVAVGRISSSTLRERPPAV